jgi:hypothetical protein
MMAIRLAHEVTGAAGGRKKISRLDAAIEAGMDTFIWNARRPFDRPERAWHYSVPYSRQQWLSIFRDGIRRLITSEELQVLGRGD